MRAHPESGDAFEEDTSRLTRIRGYFAEDVTTSWTDAILIISCFVTGLLDAAVFNTWSCFVSMMTGNTVYVGLGVSGQPKDQPWRWAKSGVAILSFVLGAFIFGHGMRLLGPLRRSTVVTAFLLQALLTYASAALTTAKVVPADAGYLLPDNFIVLIPLALLSVQSGGQCVMSRILGFGEITTVVLTSAYCDLAIDEKLLSPPRENSKRNRRLISMVMLACGAIAGGFLTEDGDISSALWLAGSMKIVIAIIWCFWKANESIRLD